MNRERYIILSIEMLSFSKEEEFMKRVPHLCDNCFKERKPICNLETEKLRSRLLFFCGTIILS